MDEQLIAEVQNHAVIYNRQKYFLNNMGTGKYENKDEAWTHIAHKLASDVDTCKKRWKYLRERYVQQRKQGDPPTYEHLSRPYLEKMKFLDQHIQPRKSYRNVSNFLASPNGNTPFGEYMDSSRSNGSTNNMVYQNYKDNILIKNEPEPSFQNFSALHDEKILHQQQQHQQQLQQHQSLNDMSTSLPAQSNSGTFQTNHNIPSNDFRETEINLIPSSSSSLKSPLSSPRNTDQNDITERSKRPRLGCNRPQDESSDNDESGEHISEARHTDNRIPPFSEDLLYSVFQQFSAQKQVKSSEYLLGELVTSELLKMSRDRKKIAQRRILEILFFDD